MSSFYPSPSASASATPTEFLDYLTEVKMCLMWAAGDQGNSTTGQRCACCFQRDGTRHQNQRYGCLWRGERERREYNKCLTTNLIGSSADFVIPKGWAALVLLNSTHLDEKNYPEALTFNPWRWQHEPPLVFDLSNLSLFFFLDLTIN